MDLGISGRTALVGGASAGLGYETARQLGREGARVVIVSRSPERIEAAAARLREETGAEVVGVAADLAEPGGPESAVDAAARAFGPVDILVINTGGPPSMPAVDATAADLEAAVRSLLLPVQRFCALCLPAMRERGWGRILAITSIAVREPQPGLVLSNSIRAAVTGYLKSLAAEVAPWGVTVNTVLPGYTATERLGELAAALAERTGTTVEEIEAGWAANAPVGRLLEPSEVAAALVFLASVPASGITGVALPVDGGLGRGLL